MEPKVIPIHDENVICNVTADLSERIVWLEFDVQESGRKAVCRFALTERETLTLRAQLDAAMADIRQHHGEGVSS